MKKENKAVEKKINSKNYVVVAVIFLILILGSLYLYKWYDVYTEEQVSTSYLMKTKTLVYEVKDLSEIEAVFSETPNEYFVYVSYTGSEDVYNLEEELKPIIEEYKLKDYIYYINVTDMMKKDNYLDELNKALGLEENKITQVPTIIFFKDGVVEDDSIITREDSNIMQAGDFAKLLDIKGIQKDHE